MRSKSKNKVKISITVPPELLGWLDSKVQERVFADRSHGMERAILALKKDMEEPEQAP